MELSLKVSFFWDIELKAFFGKAAKCQSPYSWPSQMSWWAFFHP